MSIYIIFIVLLLVEGVGLLYWKKEECSETVYLKKKKLYIILVTIEFILLSGLRSRSVGPDTWYYIEYFQAIDENYTWSQIGQYFIRDYWGERRWFEPLYTLYVKLVHMLSGNEQILLLITACIIMIPLACYIYRHSRDMSLSFMIYMCLFFQCFGITAVRQAIALSIAVMIGYQFVIERKFWKFLLCVIVATLFHTSALIMLPFYFLYNVKISKRVRICYVIAVAAVFMLKDYIVKLVCGITGYAYDGFEGTKPFNMLLIMGAVTLFVLWKYDELTERREENRGFINAILIGTLILPFTQIDSTYMRLCYYYYMFLMLIIPEILQCFSKRWRIVFTICGYAGMILLFARHGLTYSFFWQA